MAPFSSANLKLFAKKTDWKVKHPPPHSNGVGKCCRYVFPPTADVWFQLALG